MEHQGVLNQAVLKSVCNLIFGDEGEHRRCVGAGEELFRFVDSKLYDWSSHDQRHQRHDCHAPDEISDNRTLKKQMVQKQKSDDQREHPQGSVEPHRQAERHAGESVVRNTFASQCSKRQVCGQRRKERGRDAVHPNPAPIYVPAHDSHKERSD